MIHLTFYLAQHHVFRQTSDILMNRKKKQFIKIGDTPFIGMRNSKILQNVPLGYCYAKIVSYGYVHLNSIALHIGMSAHGVS